MDSIREYLLQIISSALICGILMRLMGKKGLLREAVRLMAGICMTITVLSPWADLRLDRFQDITGDISVSAESAVQEGKNSAREAISAIIKERSETYILDKAASLGAAITVEVRLTEDNIPYPSGVILSGPISPYAKSALTAYIADNLGIRMEDQKWIG